MTKQIRIENADNSPYKVLVQTWDKGRQTGPAEGECEPDTLVREEILGCPTAMTRSDTYITSTRYLVVKELLDPPK